MRRTSALGGIHWIEWLCEFVGTALLITGGLSAVCLDFGVGNPMSGVVPDPSERLLITGLLFAGSGSLVTVSPIGRRSGAHLNPAVTLAFWMRRHVSPHDVAGYIAAQCTGAIAGDAVVRGAWGRAAISVHDGLTQPGRGLSPVEAAAVEALMTAVMVFAILVMVSSPRRARWTPLVLWMVIAALVWQGAPYTGTSLNPARSLGPAVVSGTFADYWVYLVGPLAGAFAAVGIYSLIPGMETLTAKLYHDERYPSTLASLLPVRRLS